MTWAVFDYPPNVSRWSSPHILSLHLTDGMDATTVRRSSPAGPLMSVT